MTYGLLKAAILALGIGAGTAVLSGSATADTRDAAAAGAACPVSHAFLLAKLQQAAAADSTGLNNHYWGVVVNVRGVVCAVAYSGPTRESQWLASRQIAAAKAFTANGLSLDNAPLSTAQLYPWVQPGNAPNPLFGPHHGNPLDPEAAYAGDYFRFGTAQDPLVGKRAGGTISFGGGLALYRDGKRVGGLGLSGDTACADHSTAWRLRILLGLAPANPTDKIPLGSTPTGHPRCPNDAGTQGAS